MYKNIVDSLIILYSELKSLLSDRLKRNLYLKQVDFTQDWKKKKLDRVMLINLHL